MDDILLTSGELIALRKIASGGGSEDCSPTMQRDLPQLVLLGLVANNEGLAVLTGIGRQVLDRAILIPSGRPAIMPVNESFV